MTVTAPPSPPWEPLPPTENRVIDESPPEPPPPPTDWAKMPLAFLPVVSISPAALTSTSPPDPALAPLLAKLREK